MVHKSYPLEIPAELKVELPEKDVITLFVNEKEIKGEDLSKESIKAHYLENSSSLKKNGYLVNVPKSKTQEVEGGSLTLESKTY